MNKLLCAALAIMIALPATLSAKSSTRVLTVKNSVTAVRTSGNVKVEYTTASKVNAVIKADYHEDLDKVKATVSGGVLILTTEGRLRGSVKVKLAAPGVNSFEASGNSEIEIEGNVSGKTVSLVTSGNASVEIDDNVNSTNLKINSSGNSSIEVDGMVVATGADVGTSGNSSAKISVLRADRLKVKTDGNSSFKGSEINVSSVNAESNGNSSLILAGKAATVAYASNGNSVLRAGMLKANGGTAVSNGNSHIYAGVNGLQQTSNGYSRIINK